jgi:hypothetical protein
VKNLRHGLGALDSFGFRRSRDHLSVV